MDEDEIQDELLKIYGIHESFNSANPLTFVIFYEENKDNLNDDQKEWVQNRIKKLIKKQRDINNKILDKMDKEENRVPANLRINEKEHYFKQLDK